MEKLKDAVVIFSAEPGVGQSPIRATDATPYEKSLAAGPISETPLGFEYVDWNQQRTISLVIDLLGDSFIDRVTVESRF